MVGVYVLKSPTGIHLGAEPVAAGEHRGKTITFYQTTVIQNSIAIVLRNQRNCPRIS